MRISFATEYISRAIEEAVDEAYLGLVEQFGVGPYEAQEIQRLLEDATYTVDFGDGEEREL